MKRAMVVVRMKQVSGVREGGMEDGVVGEGVGSSR
jgi:hypothetical protein